MFHTISLKLRHFFHVVSNIRPIVWIAVYVALVPVFAVIYNALPDGQFRVPDGTGAPDFGSWLYYSIVTITTLGFGDYTPAGGAAQCVTAVEVMLGLSIMGFFLNAVGSMKSEIDVESELEKQRRVHEAMERAKLGKMAPALLHLAVRFIDGGGMAAARRLALALDSLPDRVDLSLWPALMEDAFAFVADYQIYSSDAETGHKADAGKYLASAGDVARRIEQQLTSIANATA
ncbi:MAG: potassium channel family protein [Muribaculaceae bacterium]|nr:potassium channel family protein [Muribaculaceae bacterium]